MSDTLEQSKATTGSTPGAESSARSKSSGDAERVVRTSSGIELKSTYRPDDVADLDYDEDLGDPGQYPFTRGIHPEMYRKRLWTFRLYAGYGQGEDTNARFRYLIEQGNTGLSLALDLPTQMGLDSDHPLAQGEVGRVGVAIDTLADMEAVFAGIPLDTVSTSITVNATANVILAMYVAVAERQGVRPSQLRGTLQNDILKEYLARGTFIFPVEPSIKLIGDTIEYCLGEAPKLNPVNVTGSHIHHAGANYLLANAIMFLDALVYIDEAIRRGYDVDQVAPLISFNSGADGDFFETVARHRASRRLWARLVKERYGAKNPRSLLYRVATAGYIRSLTVQEPLNNIARITLDALANVLGGSQSMRLPSYDEAYDIPTEAAARTSLRIQQIIAYESGAPNVVDPLAGSYYVEWLTDECERRMCAHMAEIEAHGGVVQAVASGRLQRQLARDAYLAEQRIQSGDKLVVGRNKFTSKEDRREDFEATSFVADPDAARRQIERLRRVRAERSPTAVDRALAALRQAATERRENLMPHLLDAVRAYATIGEIVGTLEQVYGTYQQPALF